MGSRERPVGQRVIVLVVKDEPLLRMMTVDMVEDAGFEALEAAGANEAICLLEDHPDVGSVFTDIDMPPGMDGLSFAALVRDRWPPMHLVGTSGHFSPGADEMPARSAFFSKPYRHEKVVATMRRMASDP